MEVLSRHSAFVVFFQQVDVFKVPGLLELVRDHLEAVYQSLLGRRLGEGLADERQVDHGVFLEGNHQLDDAVSTLQRHVFSVRVALQQGVDQGGCVLED